MSVVTNLILACSASEDESAVIEALSKYKYHGNGFDIVSIKDSRLPKGWYGGNKHFECTLFLGAYNHFDTNEFVDFLKGVQWVAPEDVQLIVKEQNEFKFKIIVIFDRVE